jgi:hypothetical protein
MMSTTELSAADLERHVAGLERNYIVMGGAAVIVMLAADLAGYFGLADMIELSGFSLIILLFAIVGSATVALMSIGDTIGPKSWRYLLEIPLAAMPALITGCGLRWIYGETEPGIGIMTTLIFCSWVFACSLLQLLPASHAQIALDALPALEKKRKRVLTVIVGTGLLIHVLLPLVFR